jgi:hypothetical protein
MTPSEQAVAILEERHLTPTRQEHKPSRYDKGAWPLRVKIDAKLAEMRDKRDQTDEIGE